MPERGPDLDRDDMRTVSGAMLLLLLLAGCASSGPTPGMTRWTSPEIERERKECLDGDRVWIETRYQFACRPIGVEEPRT